ADPQYASSVAEALKNLFPAEIQSGLLEVVSPSVHFYPDFSRLRESFGDPKERVRLRLLDPLRVRLEADRILFL
ncbi:unnamed protein product, partial [Menidia menidia]